MEAVASLLGLIVVEASKLICRPVFLKVRKIVKFQSNINKLEKEMKSLLILKSSIKEAIELAERDGTSPTIRVTEWLREAEEIEIGVISIQADVAANGENLHGCHLNCRLRYRQSKEVEKMLEEVKQIQNHGWESFPESLVAVTSQVKAVESILGRSIEGQTMAKT